MKIKIGESTDGRTVHLGMKTAERFWVKVDKTPGHGPDGACWLWTGTTNGKQGRPLFRGGAERDARGSRKWVLAYAFAYNLLVGPIPSGLEPDHSCRLKLCVNPGHIEPVTHRENVLRGLSPPALQAKQTECIRGHLFDEANGLGRERKKAEV